MIENFLQSWDLFKYTWLSGWLIGFVLSIGGVLVVARNQIFLGAAVSQASTLGIAFGMWLGIEHQSLYLGVFGMAFSVAAGALTWRPPEAGRETNEALSGWVFLVGACLSILVVSHSPNSLEEVHRLVSTSLIGKTGTEVIVFAVLAVATAVGVAMATRRLLLFSLDPDMAAAVGMNMKLWSFIMTAWLGLAVGFCIRASGMPYTFGCLVLPALIAKNVCREVRWMFVVSPAVVLATCTFGFVFANHYDYPPAHMTLALLCALLVIAWGYRRLRIRAPG